MYGGRTRSKSLARSVTRALSNCSVEVGLSVGWASVTHMPVIPAIAWDNESNLILQGIFSSNYIEAYETEGSEPSVTIPTLAPITGTPFQTLLTHESRVSISLFEDPDFPRMVYRIKSVQDNARYRSLLLLSELGQDERDIPQRETLGRLGGQRGHSVDAQSVSRKRG